MHRSLAFPLLPLALCFAQIAAADLRPDQLAFRAIYKELVETNTTLSSGSCTEAAKKMGTHLSAAGMLAEDIHLLTVPDHPKEGSLVAVLHGTDPVLKPMLLLAHLDVVEAKREDWTRDPFTLIEEDGYFYARGTVDDKSMAAIWVDTLVRFLQDDNQPPRTVKLALTCGEETSGAFNGAENLAAEHADLISAGFALNEGAWGVLDEEGNRVMLTMQAGEKLPENYQLEVTNPGGHSSRPVKKNAIYQLAAALTRVSQYEFPIHLNDTTRTFFERMGALRGGEIGAAMQELAANPEDADALAIVKTDPTYNAVLHTTCVATMLEAGHATNALPQRATANVNCRIYPTDSVEDVRQALEQVVADPEVKVSAMPVRSPIAVPPPLTPAIWDPIEATAAEIFPGLPVVPIFQAGGTDAPFLATIGIPTYGIGAYFLEPDLGHIHGLNERIGVDSLYDARDFLYALVKRLATSPDPIP
jgi:acetylornithine deacetylase/succinyl-diaminopimelate desuccinylase-like protein